MKLSSSVAVITSCVFLAACNPQQAANVVDDTQNTAVKICAFVPTATTILNLFQVVGPAATAAQVAQIVCDAVAKKGGHQWNYKDVVIEGRFVR